MKFFIAAIIRTREWALHSGEDQEVKQWIELTRCTIISKNMIFFIVAVTTMRVWALRSREDKKVYK